MNVIASAVEPVIAPMLAAIGASRPADPFNPHYALMPALVESPGGRLASHVVRANEQAREPKPIDTRENTPVARDRRGAKNLAYIERRRWLEQLREQANSSTEIKLGYVA
jgi:hypothetical protein